MWKANGNPSSASRNGTERVRAGSTALPAAALPGRSFISGLLLLLVLAPALAAERPLAAVRDLSYGEVLYHYFQDDDFTALTRLRVARTRNSLRHHQREAALLEGSLLLSYGLPDEAQAIFTGLLAGENDAALRHRVWFHLADLHQRRGRPLAAEAGLARLDKATLPPPRREAALLLHARVLMALGAYRDAIPLLKRVTGDPVQTAYARFNLGVALERAGDRAAGRTLLAALGELTAENEELLALRDKANLALGYSYLREQDPAAARAHLLRVRLDGLDTAPALLGLGWAEFGEGRLPEALQIWQALTRRGAAEPAVQEGLLAIPHALAEAGAHAQAARRYEEAIEIFAQEHTRLAALAARIRDQGVGALLLAGEDAAWQRTALRGGTWDLPAPPPDAAGRDLLRLLAGGEFQAVLQNLRELRLLDRDLKSWEGNIAAFRDMLALRRSGYEQRLPRITAGLARLDLAAVRQRRDAFAARLAAIEEREDAAALADAGELRLAARLDKVRTLLGRHPQAAELAAQRDKFHLLQGIYTWRLAQDYKPRLWSLRKALKSLDEALEAAAAQPRRLEEARTAVPRGFAGYEQRIESLARRLAALQARSAAALAKHETYLQASLLQVLTQRSTRLRTYETQARYGLARLHDLAAAQAAHPAATEDGP